LRIEQRELAAGVKGRQAPVDALQLDLCQQRGELRRAPAYRRLLDDQVHAAAELARCDGGRVLGGGLRGAFV
jgi:hypothetical protein